MVSIYRPSNSPQAWIIRNLLINHGMEVQIDGADLHLGAGELPVGWATAPSILVFEQDAELAREIIENFEAGKYSPTDPSWQVVDFASEEFDWPECPRCQELASAHCSECGFTGIDFEVEMNFQAPEGELDELRAQSWHPFLLKCPVCQERMAPQFQHTCTECAHEFSGKQFANTRDEQVPFEANPQFHRINWAVIVTAGILLLCLLLGVLYFLMV